MNMVQSLLFAIAILFSGATLSTEVDKKCTEGSEAPECQMKKSDDDSSS
ncbi:hypothetical protein SAMN02745132_04271 [Enterovibrio nigricans DSM 22720]|uniref:Uncharacterized protein n=1 Tax=Enterovibrio nigricans DSM 22720 TaxID=1121868 RepID=A0A1T4VTC5_9GAMM|nr:hypothetical protein SAMN02745132_04271 [Enterovibrio nigricans DSM 22720]